MKNSARSAPIGDESQAIKGLVQERTNLTKLLTRSRKERRELGVRTPERVLRQRVAYIDRALDEKNAQ